MEVFTRTDSSADDPPMQTMLRSTAAEESARVNRALYKVNPFSAKPIFGRN